jgi:hypothetical protein
VAGQESPLKSILTQRNVWPRLEYVGGLGYASMMVEDDPELEYSRLCGDVARDGITVRVKVYRLAGGREGWSLEVVDQEGASTVWPDLFATDEEAYAEFQRTLEIEGIHSFAERATGRPH